MITPISLSGDHGTRLWPMSRKAKPKQFIELIDNETMFTQTIKRVSDKKYFTNPIVLGNIKHDYLIQKELKKNNIPTAEVVLEPKARNTAPAISAVIEYLYKENRRDEIVVFLPADAYIKDAKIFQDYLLEGVKLAQDNKVVCFGIRPLYPETGYGYIKLDNKIENNSYLVEKFVEKPNFETAQEYCNSSNYLWNAGIFMSKVSTLYNLFKKFQPELLEQIEITISKSKKESNQLILDKDTFIQAKDISIDYAIIENLDSSNLAVVSMNLTWSDLGSYASLFSVNLEKCGHNNITEGKTILYNSSNNYIKANKKIICCANVENMVIVEEDDIILVMPISKSQDIKKLIDKIKEQDMDNIL